MRTAATNVRLWSYARACRRLAALMKPDQHGHEDAGGAVAAASAALNEAAAGLIEAAGARSSRLPNWLVESVLTTALGPESDESLLDAGPSPEHRQALRATGAFASAADMLAFAALTCCTGRLEVVTPVETFRFELADGMLVHAESDATPPGGRLGDILVEQGAVTRDEIERALARDPDKRLGEAVWQDWLVTAHQLRRALTEQARQHLARAVGLPPLRFMFWAGPPRQAGSGLGLDVLQLLATAMAEHPADASPTAASPR